MPTIDHIFDKKTTISPVTSRTEKTTTSRITESTITAEVSHSSEIKPTTEQSTRIAKKSTVSTTPIRTCTGKQIRIVGLDVPVTGMLGGVKGLDNRFVTNTLIKISRTFFINRKILFFILRGKGFWRKKVF